MQRTAKQFKNKHKTCDYQAVELAREYISENLSHVISLDDLENITGQDRWQLSRDFRALYGTSPYRYLVLRRLDKARNMMLTGSSAAESAIACNFSDQSHMNRHFKKAFGLTPRQLTNSIQTTRPSYM